MTADHELHPLRCARAGCGHRYSGEHAPGGGNCMVWDPVTELHCACRGFQWVPLGTELHPYRAS
jgi:hypothetical protein